MYDPGSPPFFIENSPEIGRAHVWTPVTPISRMPSSAWKKKKKQQKKKKKTQQKKKKIKTT